MCVCDSVIIHLGLGACEVIVPGSWTLTDTAFSRIDDHDIETSHLFIDVGENEWKRLISTRAPVPTNTHTQCR